MLLLFHGRAFLVTALIVAMALPSFAAKKFSGTTTLKDCQPANTPDNSKKNKTHQTFDLSFDAEGKNYTCRTSPNKSMNATDFVVGSSINYEVDGQKATIKTSEGKKLQCTVVRVQELGTAAAAPTGPAVPQ
jgi:hypothetical protein